MNKKIDNRGFTLVELIATIAILAVISVISFVSINAVIKKNDVKNCESLVNNIKSAAREYVSDNRYKSLFVDNADKNGMNIVVGVGSNSLNLSDEIYDYFGDSVISNIKIGISLNDDYTANEVNIYMDKDTDGVMDTDEVFSCSQEWLQQLSQ